TLIYPHQFFTSKSLKWQPFLASFDFGIPLLHPRSIGGIKMAWDERESNNQSAWKGAEWTLAGSACEKEVKFQTWSKIETLCKEVEP
ncbi:hypothetical protein Gogos_009111, partial [Gossypium gossypioides]|nr:hypothetical protein [Gossypium gossypioides]